MTTTAGDIIEDALQLIGVYGPGDQISAADAARGLSVLNDLFDVWSNESLSCYAWTSNSFILIPGQYAYTIGPGGNINAARPLRVSDDSGSAFLTDQDGNRYLMDVVDQMTWNIRTQANVNSNLPDTLLYDPQYPLGIIKVWPTPIDGYTCTFSSYLQLADLSTLTSAFSLPPGYKRAVVTNLAVMLKPYFTNAQIDPLVMNEAMLTKGTVKRTNMRQQRSIYEPELIARGSSTYNIRSDRNY
jgi:hypothetical protein